MFYRFGLTLVANYKELWEQVPHSATLQAGSVLELIGRKNTSRSAWNHYKSLVESVSPQTKV